MVDFTVVAEHIVTCEASKEDIWLHKFLTDLQIIHNMDKLLIICDNNGGVVVNLKDQLATIDERI